MQTQCATTLWSLKVLLLRLGSVWQKVWNCERNTTLNRLGKLIVSNCYMYPCSFSCSFLSLQHYYITIAEISFRCKTQYVQTARIFFVVFCFFFFCLKSILYKHWTKKVIFFCIIFLFSLIFPYWFSVIMSAHIWLQSFLFWKCLL